MVFGCFWDWIRSRFSIPCVPIQFFSRGVAAGRQNCGRDVICVCFQNGGRWKQSELLNSYAAFSIYPLLLSSPNSTNVPVLAWLQGRLCLVGVFLVCGCSTCHSMVFGWTRLLGNLGMTAIAGEKPASLSTNQTDAQIVLPAKLSNIKKAEEFSSQKLKWNSSEVSCSWSTSSSKTLTTQRLELVFPVCSRVLTSDSGVSDNKTTTVLHPTLVLDLVILSEKFFYWRIVSCYLRFTMSRLFSRASEQTYSTYRCSCMCIKLLYFLIIFSHSRFIWPCLLLTLSALVSAMNKTIKFIVLLELWIWRHSKIVVFILWKLESLTPVFDYLNDTSTKTVLT